MENKAKLEKLLNLDCEKNENIIKITDFIMSMKPVQKMAKNDSQFTLDIETLEKIKQGLCIRYGYRNQGILEHYEIICNKKEDGTTEDIPARFVFYNTSILTKERKWIGNVYGKTLWELTAKMIIKIYENVKYGKEEE